MPCSKKELDEWRYNAAFVNRWHHVVIVLCPSSVFVRVEGSVVPSKQSHGFGQETGASKTAVLPMLHMDMCGIVFTAWCFIPLSSSIIVNFKFHTVSSSHHLILSGKWLFLARRQTNGKSNESIRPKDPRKMVKHLKRSSWYEYAQQKSKKHSLWVNVQRGHGSTNLSKIWRAGVLPCIVLYGKHRLLVDMDVRSNKEWQIEAAQLVNGEAGTGLSTHN